jgi:hypothetical protein
MLIDFKLLENVMKVTCLILQNNFFYSEGCLALFLNDFQDRLEFHYHKLEDQADNCFRIQMKNDRIARKNFTAYFVSYHLHDTLVEDCHFSEIELDLFENILPKYTGVHKDGLEQSEQRKNNRELFKGL